MCRLENEVVAGCDACRASAAKVQRPEAHHALSAALAQPAARRVQLCAQQALQQGFPCLSCSKAFAHALHDYHKRMYQMFLRQGFPQLALDHSAKLPAGWSDLNGLLMIEIKLHGGMPCLREALRLFQLRGIKLDRCGNRGHQSLHCALKPCH